MVAPRTWKTVGTVALAGGIAVTGLGMASGDDDGAADVGALRLNDATPANVERSLAQALDAPVTVPAPPPLVDSADSPFDGIDSGDSADGALDADGIESFDSIDADSSPDAPPPPPPPPPPPAANSFDSPAPAPAADSFDSPAPAPAQQSFDSPAPAASIDSGGSFDS